MKKMSGWPCWKVMNCGIQRVHCPAYHQPETPCWEIARKLNDYRRLYDICSDCIVYVFKQENSVLSDQEIEAIMKHKVVCAPTSTAHEVFVSESKI